MTKTCETCGQEFECRSDDVTKCWCREVPAIEGLSDGECLCQKCLTAKSPTFGDAIADLGFNRAADLFWGRKKS